jgi:hypothetical protein
MPLSLKDYMETPLIELVAHPEFDPQELPFVLDLYNTPVKDLMKGKYP